MTAVDLRLDHLAIATRFAAAPEQWPLAPRFNPIDRWYRRIAVADDYEVWLLTWLPGQGTELHDHGGSAGAFHVLSGSLVEDTVAAGTPASTSTPTPHSPTRITAREWGAGAGRRFGPRHIHRISNVSTRPAISIHVYGPALTSMTRYRLGADGLDVVTVEKAGVQW